MGNSDKFQRETSLRASLFTIPRNVYYSQYRKRTREVQDSDGVFARGIAVVRDRESHLDLADFRIALAKLPAEQRKVLREIGYLPSSRTRRKFSLAPRNFPLASGLL